VRTQHAKTSENLFLNVPFFVSNFMFHDAPLANLRLEPRPHLVHDGLVRELMRVRVMALAVVVVFVLSVILLGTLMLTDRRTKSF
jgi:hypothetical protein